MEIKKNQDYIIDIVDVGSSGEGIGKIDNFTVFVENTVIGDRVKIKIVKLKKSYGYGKLLDILTQSPNRVKPECIYSDKCGGCQLQNYNYKTQLEIKQKIVKDNLERIAKLPNIDLPPITGMTNTKNYRNKAQFPVGVKDNKVQIGFYSKRSHNIIDIDNCYINHEINCQIIKILKNFISQYNISVYDEINHKGLIRHILTRIGFKTNQLMVCIIINGNKLPHSSELVENLKAIKNIKSIALNHNTNKNNVILGDKTEILWGSSYINDYIGDIKFEISPTSFFQVNPIQTKILYDKVLEFAELKGNEIVWDTYCGIGTISLFIAKKAKKVYGIEIVKSAIKDAKHNAKINNINNVEFYEGNAETFIPELYENNKIKTDILILDPPRKGCSQKLIDTIVKIKPNKIIYVSCNSATLARDLQILKEYYNISKIYLIDLFPNSIHVETVALLSLKTGTPKIEVTMEVDSDSNYSPEEKATYQKIKEYVKDKYSVNVHTRYIAEVKRMCGINMGENYNKSKKENPDIKHCPKEKAEYIIDALKYFKLI